VAPPSPSTWSRSLTRTRLQPGDEILLTALEHHANIVPWQLVAEQTGVVIKAVPMDRRGVIDWRASRRT
jgi:cysteine desulfurase/selenocysteine lyase